jgi:hypothetical protein
MAEQGVDVAEIERGLDQRDHRELARALANAQLAPPSDRPAKALRALRVIDD